MKPVTAAINTNEKAMSLREENMVRPPTHQSHRYQIIVVVRDDKLAEWWRDLGPSENFKGNGFQIPSLMEHSVAELLDIAEASRHDDSWQKEMAGVVAESTMISDFLDQYEERWEIMHNRSTFGPGVTHQRNGAPSGYTH